MASDAVLPKVRHDDFAHGRNPTRPPYHRRRYLRRSHLVQYRQAHLGSVKAAVGLPSRERRHLRARLRGAILVNKTQLDVVELVALLWLDLNEIWDFE